jgi:hypothetical protein
VGAGEDAGDGAMRRELAALDSNSESKDTIRKVFELRTIVRRQRVEQRARETAAHTGNNQGDTHASATAAASAALALDAQPPATTLYKFYWEEESRIKQQRGGSFVIVGICITKCFAEYNERQQRRNDKFFALLDAIPASLPRAIMFQILRLCAFPRMIFYCAATPPDEARVTVAKFQRELVQRVSDLIEVDWTDANREAIHQRHGLGLPDLINNSHMLYSDAMARFQTGNYNKRRRAIEDATSRLVHQPGSVQSERLDRHLGKNSVAPWLFCNRRGASEPPLINENFIICLALRAYALPRRYSFATINHRTGAKTNSPYCCGFCTLRIDDDQTYIDHLFECKAGVEHVNPSTRHNWLKYAISSAISHHGISCTVEPRMLSAGYEQRDNDEYIDRRPDLLCRTAVPIVTDFGIVMQAKKCSVGDGARAYARDKHQLHHAACERLNMKYFSYVVEVYGHLDSDARHFIDHVVRHVPAVSRRALDFELNYVTSLVLARTRALMIVQDQASRNFVTLS